MELQSRIFERFFRADKVRSRTEGDSSGAGLGLAICKWIAEAHKGLIELTRSDATGSTFTLYLPRGTKTSNLMEKEAHFQGVTQPHLESAPHVRPKAPS